VVGVKDINLVLMGQQNPQLPRYALRGSEKLALLLIPRAKLQHLGHHAGQVGHVPDDLQFSKVRLLVG